MSKVAALNGARPNEADEAYLKAFNEEVQSTLPEGEEGKENNDPENQASLNAEAPEVDESGPYLEVPSRHLSFTGLPDELISHSLAVGNDGPCVLHYFWEKVTHRHPSSHINVPKSRRPLPVIAWKYMSGTIAPGEMQRWPVFFLAEQPGVITSNSFFFFSTALFPLDQKKCGIYIY